ncbi:restriction endonuclease [Candidatus Gracilibacteria bacterium]|nr:restriction endonuclease [Candidatus Gracilibacteria bacterium]MCF7898540.1 restriction endonuclease [Candidatus Paceibacterota bacterium]
MIFNTVPKDWKDLQNCVGQMFRECGFETEVSKVVDLVRGKKEIDVYAKDASSAYQPIFLVECKFWNKPVDQETIHSFRTVVSDFGANTGFIVSKNGFQKGALNAVVNTNIQLVSLDGLCDMYYSRWRHSMYKKYLPYADTLFPYWDDFGKKAADGNPISYTVKQIVYDAYQPICSLGPLDQLKGGFSRVYPMVIPEIDDNLEIIGEKIISNDREYFNFCEQNKEKAIKHFKILFRE